MWRPVLVAFVLWLIFVDMVRKVTGATPTLLLAGDALLVGAYLLFWLERVIKDPPLRERTKYMPLGMAVALFVWTALVVVQALNPRVIAPVVAIAGLRSYLLAVPAIALGAHAVRSMSDLANMYRLTRAIAFVTIAVAVYQVSMDPAALGVALLSLDSDLHSFGDTVYRLVPSTFASADRFGRMLMISYPLLAGAAAVLNRSRAERVVIATAYLAAAFICGKKDVLILLLFFHVGYWVLNRKSGLSRGAAITAIIAAAFLLWTTVLSWDAGDITPDNAKFKRVAVSQQEWRMRLGWYLIAPLTEPAMSYSPSELLWGAGLGTYGAETSMLGDVGEVRRSGLNREFGYESGATDSAMAKLHIEFGKIGLGVAVAAWLLLLISLARQIGRAPADIYTPLVRRLSLVPIAWTFLVLRGHNAFSDSMLSFGLWFSIGVMLALTSRPVSKAPALTVPGYARPLSATALYADSRS